MAISIKVPLIVFVLFSAGGDDKFMFEKAKEKSKTSQENANEIRRR